MERCPLCRARLGGAAVCPRCGADLSRVQAAAAQARRHQQQALAALAAGELATAEARARQALRFHHTRLGEIMADWLADTAAKATAPFAQKGASTYKMLE